MKKILSKFLLLSILIPCSGHSQDVAGLIELIEAGNIDSAETVLSDLSYSYPGNPGVRYARALMQTDALLAAGLYKDILRNHRDSEYVPGSLMHLGEYYYAIGSYVQSRELFMDLIRHYPDFPEIQNAINLSLRAGIAARQRDNSYMDSVHNDLAEILKGYPDREFDIPEELDLTRIPSNQIITDNDPLSSPPLVPLRSLGEGVTAKESTPTAEYTLQAGAFGNYDNARRLADQIESIGYTTDIKERPSNGKTLYLIWVGEYATKTAALSVADMLEAALGIQSFPVAID